MLQPLSVPIQQNIPGLRSLQKRHPGKYKALQMLVLLKQQGDLSKDKLSLLLGSSDKSISIWRKQYLAGGIAELLVDKRGGKKPGNMAFIFLPRYSPELNPAEKMWRYFKDRVSMIAYNSLEMLQQKLSEITNLISPDLIKSICGNQFYKNTLRSSFNV